MGLSLGGIGDAFGDAFGGFLGGSFGGLLGDEMGLGRKSLKKGYEYQNRYSARYEQEMWERAEGRGLTAQEYYGSSVPGSASSNPGGASVLGNNVAQMRQMASDNINRALDRQTDLKKAEIGAQATMQSAKTSADASMYSSDTNKAIAEGRLKLDRDTYQFINLPQAAAQIGLTEAQTKKAINEIATSDPQYVLYMKKLSMGVDNMISEMYQQMHDFDVTDKQSLLKFDTQKREALLAGMLALQSVTAKEAGFFTGLGDQFIEAIRNIGSNPLGMHKPIEQTPGAAKALGRGRNRLKN